MLPYRKAIGQLLGIISFTKSPVAQESLTLVSVAILNHNRTSYGKTLELQFGMRGAAEILAEKKKLLTRLFEGIKYAFSRA